MTISGLRAGERVRGVVDLILGCVTGICCLVTGLIRVLLTGHVGDTVVASMGCTSGTTTVPGIEGVIIERGVVIMRSAAGRTLAEGLMGVVVLIKGAVVINTGFVSDIIRPVVGFMSVIVGLNTFVVFITGARGHVSEIMVWLSGIVGVVVGVLGCGTTTKLVQGIMGVDVPILYLLFCVSGISARAVGIIGSISGMALIVGTLGVVLLINGCLFAVGYIVCIRAGGDGIKGCGGEAAVCIRGLWRDPTGSRKGITFCFCESSSEFKSRTWL